MNQAQQPAVDDPPDIFELSETKKIQISEFKSQLRIDFREYYVRQDGGTGPTRKGISINVDLWEKFLGAIEDINEAIARR